MAKGNSSVLGEIKADRNSDTQESSKCIRKGLDKHKDYFKEIKNKIVFMLI